MENEETLPRSENVELIIVSIKFREIFVYFSVWLIKLVHEYKLDTNKIKSVPND